MALGNPPLPILRQRRCPRCVTCGGASLARPARLQVCGKRGHSAGFVGAKYVDCPNKPCYLCGKQGHSTMTCPFRQALLPGMQAGAGQACVHALPLPSPLPSSHLPALPWSARCWPCRAGSRPATAAPWPPASAAAACWARCASASRAGGRRRRRRRRRGAGRWMPRCSSCTPGAQHAWSSTPRW